MQIGQLKKSHHSEALGILKKLHDFDSGSFKYYFWSDQDLALELKEGLSIGLWNEEGILVSFIAYRILSDAQEVSFLATDPSQQGRAYMRKLLNHLVNAIGHNSPTWLEVHEANMKARKLYETVGFVETGRRSQYYRDGGAAILMECKPRA